MKKGEVKLTVPEKDSISYALETLMLRIWNETGNLDNFGLILSRDDLSVLKAEYDCRRYSKNKKGEDIIMTAMGDVILRRYDENR